MELSFLQIQIPKHLRDRFKKACKKKDVTMRTQLTEFIKDFSKDTRITKGTKKVH